MADFNSKKPSATYESILNVGTADNQSIDGTLRVVQDARGTTSALSISTTSGIQVDNIKIDANTISSENSNGEISIAPNGSGDVILGTDTVKAGSGNETGVYQSNGDFNVVLQTGNSDTGTITITDGDDQPITITPAGTGSVVMSKVDINAGTIDATTVGSTTAAAGAFTTLTGKGDGAAQFDVQNSSSHQTITVKNDASPNQVIVNEGGLGTVDFRVESVGDPYMLSVDASTNTMYINKGMSTPSAGTTLYISNRYDVAMDVGDAGVVFNGDSHATNDFRVASATSAKIDDSHCFFIDSSLGVIGIGEDSPDALLHAKTGAGSAFEVLKLEQGDVDQPFIRFQGTSASDQTKSLSTDTSVGALTGHILIDINGTDYWIPFYAKN